MVQLSDTNYLFPISEILESKDGDGMYGYIDLETGEVLYSHRNAGEPLELKLDELDEKFETRYLSIPHWGSQYSLEDMEKFIKVVTNAQLKTLERKCDRCSRTLESFSINYQGQ